MSVTITGTADMIGSTRGHVPAFAAIGNQLADNGRQGLTKSCDSEMYS
jgi:hypothetical protein